MAGGGRWRRGAEWAYVALLLIVAGAVWREAERLPPAPYDPLGPASFPRWAAAALAALALAMATRMLTGRRLGSSSVRMVTASEGDHARSPATAVLTVLLAFAYAALLGLRQVSFLAATGIYIFAAGAALGPLTPRRLGVVGLVAAAAAFALDLAFRRLFRLDL